LLKFRLNLTFVYALDPHWQQITFVHTDTEVPHKDK